MSLGFALGRIYGTFDIYRQAGSGDYINIPLPVVRSLFEEGTVYVSYPAGWTIMAARRDQTTVTLIARWESASLQITCNKSNPTFANGLLTSNYTPSGGELELSKGNRKTQIAVSASGTKALKLEAAAVSSLLSFMVDTPFPDRVVVAGRLPSETKSKPLYDIPTIGVQNVAATMTGSGDSWTPVPQPPSDPFRVMKSHCG